MAGPALSGEVRSALVGFAAGEALGTPWEGRTTREVRGTLRPAAPGTLTARLLAALEAATGTPAPGAAAAPGDGALVEGFALGLAEGDPARRRAAAAELGFPAVLVATLTAWGLEGRSLRHATYDAADGWFLPTGGVRGPRAVLAALLRLMHDYERVADAIPAAVKLGGETTLLAALAGGVAGSRLAGASERLAWIGDVELPAGLDALAARIAAARRTPGA